MPADPTSKELRERLRNELMGTELVEGCDCVPCTAWLPGSPRATGRGHGLRLGPRAAPTAGLQRTGDPGLTVDMWRSRDGLVWQHEEPDVEGPYRRVEVTDRFGTTRVELWPVSPPARAGRSSWCRRAVAWLMGRS